MGKVKGKAQRKPFFPFKLPQMANLGASFILSHATRQVREKWISLPTLNEPYPHTSVQPVYKTERVSNLKKRKEKENGHTVLSLWFPSLKEESALKLEAELRSR